MEKKWFLLGLAAILLANPASSQNCPSVEPTCEGMGYIHTAEECAGKQTIKCPFDTTKLFCGGSGGGECDGNKIKVGDLCYPNYGSCEAAGYSTTSDGCGSVKLYVNGEEKTCYYHCCPSGYYKIDGDCRKPYKTCAAAGYSDTDTGCGDVVIYIESNASFLKKRCYKSKCCKDSEVDVGGSCEPYYSSCSNAGAAQSPAKSLQDSSNSCPVTPQYWIGTSASDAQKKTCYDADCCAAGTCRVGSSCETLYASCSAYQSGWSTTTTSCGSAIIYTGSSCSTAQKVTCYKQDCCSGANRCKTVYGTCVDCYSSCEAAGYKSVVSSEQDCQEKGIYLGSGNGATVSGSGTCYYDCSDACTGAGKCKYDSRCVDCYSSCSAAGYKDTQPTGQTCSLISIYYGSGHGTSATIKSCYTSCSTTNTCTGTNKCKDSSGNCVDCYSSCSQANSSYQDSQPTGQTCLTEDVWIGSGNAAIATSKKCYYDCSYNSCSAWNSNALDSKPTDNRMWTEQYVSSIGSGKTCYIKGDVCTGGKIVSSDGSKCYCQSPLIEDTSSGTCKSACSKTVANCTTYDSEFEGCKCTACEANYNISTDASTGERFCKYSSSCSGVTNCLVYDTSCACQVCASELAPNDSGTACGCPSKYQDVVDGSCEYVYPSCHAAGYLTSVEAWEMDGTYGSSTPTSAGSFYIDKSGNGMYTSQNCYTTTMDCSEQCIEKYAGTGRQPERGEYCGSTSGTCGKNFSSCNDAGLQEVSDRSDNVIVIVDGHDGKCYVDVAPNMTTYDRRDCLEDCFNQYSYGYSPKNSDADYMYAMDVCKEACPFYGSPEYYVVLTSYNSAKMEVIKAVQSSTGLGLKDSKTVVDNLPVLIKASSSQNANSIKSSLQSAGATASVKDVPY